MALGEAEDKYVASVVLLAEELDAAYVAGEDEEEASDVLEGSSLMVIRLVITEYCFALGELDFADEVEELMAEVLYSFEAGDEPMAYELALSGLADAAAAIVWVSVLDNKRVLYGPKLLEPEAVPDRPASVEFADPVEASAVVIAALEVTMVVGT